ncbi:MAG: M48 family metalloprotease [Paracoccaceae bacterium]
MTKFVPLLLIAAGLYLWWRYSALQSGRALRAGSRPLSNDQLGGLIGRLAETAGVDRVQVRVLEEPTINGLVTPKGEIYVTRGLVREVQAGRISGPEFASVVAHELGHLALGHTQRRMATVAGAQIAQIVVGSILARLIPFVGAWLAQMMAGAFVASLSRQDEFQADAYGTALMIRSGLGAEPQARMLEKLEELMPELARMKGTTAWLASHPPVADRAHAIRENAARWMAPGS